MPAAVKGASISVQSNKTYEQTFDLEMKKALEGKTKNTPWGSTFRAPPEVLHGELGVGCVLHEHGANNQGVV